MKKINLFLILTAALLYAGHSSAQNYYAGGTGTNAAGYGAGGSVTNNVAIGPYSQSSGVTVGANTSVGVYSLRNVLGGSGNCAYGDNAGATITTGNFNVANGYDALSQGNPSYCVAVGDAALQKNTANFTTAVGAGALTYNTSGYGNVAVGAYGSYNMVTGNNNTSLGYQALYTSTASGGNTAVGFGAAYYNTTGTPINAFGDSALYGNTSGSGNSGFGYQALLSNSTGSYNTALGNLALKSATTSYNTALGYGAGYLRNGYNYCTFVGFAADANSNWSNSTSLGYNAYVQGSNTIQLGNTAITAINCNTTVITTSDQRVKKDIKENVPGISFIKSLRPVTYHYDMHKMDEMVYGERAAEYEKNMSEGIEAKGKILYTGFLAQEVEASAHKLGYDFSGVKKPQNDKDMYGLAYSEFVVPLVKGMQEQQSMIESQSDKIKSLEQKLSQQQDLAAQQQAVLTTAMAKIESMSSQLNDIKECCNSNTDHSGTGSVPSTDPQLFNTVPNPASNATVVYYYIPGGVTTAAIQLSDVSGKVLQATPLTATGYASTQLQVSQLAGGVYYYTLIVDGKVISSKKMQVTSK